MAGTPSSPGEIWTPPGHALKWQDGLWVAPQASAISYPEEGNEHCFAVEDGSYWFQHRLACIEALVDRFPPDGTLFDIGGGNGQVAAALQAAGWDTAVIEPGPGARNALRRGVRKVIQATLTDTGFAPATMDAAGVFDVMEHIADDSAFLTRVRTALKPGGRFYCTVPALASLWSAADVHAGHFRRYNRASLCATLQGAGFTVEFTSYFFSWLTLPVLLFRALPTRFRLVNQAVVGRPEVIQADHRLPAALSGLVGRAHAWELARVQARRPLRFGTSLLCVARANGS